MAKKNFTISTVATAPSPATSGTSLVVASGDGSLFAVNEPAIVFPVNDQPLVANAEIVMVTNVATDTLTITRTQESTSARTIVEGDIIIQGITAKDWNDLKTLVAGKITAFADPNADRIVFWDDSAGAFAALTASTGLTISGTNMTVRAASETATGIVELATTAETETGTDATRAVTPNGLRNMTTLAGASWFLDEDDMASNSAVKTASQQSIKAYVDSKGFTWKGAWATSTSYSVNDTVENNGSGYVCVTAHTSGTFATDLSAGKWNLLVEGLPTPNLTTSTTTNLTGVITGNGSVLASKANPSGAIVGTTDTQELSGKTLTSPILKGSIGGWISIPVTCSYASADDPTYTMYVSGNATTYLWAGMRFKCTQTTDRMFIITAVGTYDSGNNRTPITLYGGTDFDLANATITNPYYSPVKCPYGFPMSPDKWAVTYTNSSEISITTGTTWAQFTGAQLDIPIGVWVGGYECYMYDTNVVNIETKRTLSTSTNSASNAEFTYAYYHASVRNDIMVTKVDKVIAVTSKTRFYLLGLSNNDNTTAVNRGANVSPTIIKFRCVYL